MEPMVVKKVPNLTCKKCGSFRVIMTDGGPECDECDTNGKSHNTNLSMEVEYLIYQLNCKENKDEVVGCI
ncbi:hypothetical protein LCGC14_1696810 [marine sediment metagenome]|uniref:Uncharacterized protein n=1 Tax=marine sediment metagenome TaxID=412755 RepID=A0A0F9KJ64_9ZZZZ